MCLKGNFKDPRYWNNDFQKWCENSEKNNKPGPHPWPDHLWNTHPELYDFEQHEEYLE